MTTQINQLTELTTTSDGDLLLIRENATGVDKKMQAVNLRAKATTKDDVGLGNVDNVSAADLRDRSTHTGTQTLSTISDAGTIASQDADDVAITGGDITADALTSGTVPSARIDGNYTGIDRTAALFSHPTTTGSVTTTHLRAVIASSGSTASNNPSAVLASNSCTASGIRSAVISCDASQATTTRSLVAASLDSTASGSQSAVVASDDSTASGPQSAVISCVNNTQVTGAESAAIGCNLASCTSTRSTVIGSFDTQSTSSQCATISSIKTINNSSGSLALGHSATGSPLTANRKIHLFGETGNASIAGTLTQNATFTDFAEMMPNGTGAEIEAGMLLTLENGSVRPADEGEEICGVVSHTAAILAGDTPFCWQGRYMHDEFGRRLYEDILDPDWKAEIPDPDWDGEGEQPMIPNPEPQPTITVLKENPDWDPSKPQVSRSDRPDEWTPVGMIGQVYVRLGEQVQAGDRITGKQGLGYKSTERTGVRVMSVTKDYDDDYGIARCLLNIQV